MADTGAGAAGSGGGGLGCVVLMTGTLLVLATGLLRPGTPSMLLSR